MFTSDPVLDVLMLANGTVSVLLPLVLNLVMAVVAVMASRRSGRWWVAAAGVWGAVLHLASTVGMLGVTAFLARSGGVESMMYGQQVLGLASALGSLAWWALLLTGLYRLSRD